MTTGIKNYSTTPGDNDAAPPDGAPEGWFPSQVNAVVRQIMAEIRKWFEDADWIDYGHAGMVYFDATNFKVTDDKTAIYQVGRRVRAIGTTPFTIYGRITAAVYSAPDTTVTVAWDSGTLNNTLSEIAVGDAITGKPINYNGIDVPDGSITNAKLATQPVVIPTGLIAAFAFSTAPAAWVMVSSRTIGNAASGGTERANADTEALFVGLWNEFDNTELPIQDSSGVASTRGANAAADYAANKRLPVLDLRGRIIAGLDNMGGTAASRITSVLSGIDGTVIGAAGGAEAHILTTDELPNFSLKSGSGTTASNIGIYGTTTSDAPGSAGQNLSAASGAPTRQSLTSSIGSDDPHSIVQPTMMLPYIIKL